MKPAEYRAMSDEHLTLTLKENVKNLFHLRFQSATERLETPSEIKKAKKDVARIKTDSARARSWPLRRGRRGSEDQWLRQANGATAASKSAWSPATR